ncbi:MAG TPA: PorV/PorQ family protein [Bacteroidetes bacterium]|nr:PorV/PorQ family protein [Bacteroidota bacterium]
MKKIKIYLILLALIGSTFSYAGNPDRQGEAGANELLFNPWASSAALHGLNTSSIFGVAAMRLNIAGISRGYDKAMVALSNTRLYEGSDLQFNSLGITVRMGKSGALGVSLAALDFGDIPITTENAPEGTGGTYSPSFYHLGVGYSYTYEKKISVGALLRLIGESTNDISAFGAAIDAGVQYVSGERDNFKLGIALRNIGTPMKFGGSALNFRGKNPEGNTSYELTFQHRAAGFELPSLLNMGISYDYYFSNNMFLRGMTSYTSNAFSLDQIGAGLEFNFRDILILRGSYMYELGQSSIEETNIYSGVAGGFSVNVPLSKKNKNKLALDYAYRATYRFRGSHNFSVRIII